jgi:hypothetical protein
MLARRRAAVAYKLALASKPASLVARIRGTSPRPLNPSDREAFKASLDVVYGLGLADRATTIDALDSVGEGVRPGLISEARELLEGRFWVFGRPVHTDPLHPDWHADFFSGHRFRRLLPSEAIREAAYPGGYDIIVPWEFSRFHFGLRLGQAYWLTGEEEYAERLRHLLVDWIEANRYGLGVNWTSSMDAGIRAVNWLAALRLVRDSHRLDDGFWDLVHESLLVHGRHIRGRLAGVYADKRNTNHYMSCAVALLVIGACCRGEEARSWYRFGLQEIGREALSQVNEDGGHFEESPCYHRLVLELLLVGVGTAERCGDGDAIDEDVYERIDAMLDYVVDYTRPDGSSPGFGDSDSGRVLVPFAEDGATNVSHHLETVALGAMMRGRPELLGATGDEQVSAAWAHPERLLAARHGVPPSVASPPETCRVRPLTGTAILRSERVHVVAKCGGNGQDGFGGHSHNDKLSLELCDADGPVLVDSGTYCYTLDYRERARFRSTSAHNTLGFEGVEQNPADPLRSFGFEADGPVRILLTAASGDHQGILCEFAGYGALEGAPVHRRLVLLDTVHDVLVVDDAVVARSTCRTPCTLGWHLSPRVVSADLGSDRLAADLGHGPPWSLEWLSLHAVGSLDATVEPSEYSERYGKKEPASVLRLTWRMTGDRGCVRTLAHRSADSEAVHRSCEAADRLREALLA